MSFCGHVILLQVPCRDVVVVLVVVDSVVVFVCQGLCGGERESVDVQ